MFNEAVNSIMQGIEQGVLTPDDVDNLQKAISAGYGYAGKPTDLTYGGVIQTESLETTLKSVTFDMKNLKMWPAISIDKASNLFEQYNRLTSYGSDSAPYLAEGGAPQEEDSSYIRDGQRIVFFGTRRKVSHQMTLIKTTVGDVVAQQAKEGTMHLLKNVEREMYWGHAHFVDALGNQSGQLSDLPSDSIAMNGLLQQLLRGDADEQHRSGDFEGYGSFESIVRDLDGQVLTQDDVEELSVILLENFGSPGEIHIEPLALSSFVRQFYPQFRSAPGLANQTVGYDVSKVQTTAGAMDLKPNLFLRPRGKAREKAVNANCPGLPGALTGADGGAATGALEAGTYQYRITEVSDFGESAPRNITTAVVVAANDSSVVLTVPAAQAGTKYYKVYRSASGGSAASAQFIGNYKVGLGAYVDADDKRPGLGEAFMLDMSAECMRFKQLAPLSKINFAIVTTALEFAIVLYGALFVYTPRFNGCWKNVGK
jgi:hypothetical protein